MAKITPFNASCRDSSVTTLIVGFESTGKHEIAKCLVDMGSAVGLKVHTCNTLPLPEDSPVGSMNVPFICFVMHIAIKESFQTLLHCIGKVDISYFLGRSAIIVNTSCNSIDEGIPYSHVRNIGTQYGIPVLFRDIKNMEERAELGRTLMSMIETALGHFSNVTPFLYDVCMTGGQLLREPSFTQSRTDSRSQTIGIL